MKIFGIDISVWQKDMDLAKAAGLGCGAYQWGRAKNKAQAREEAELFIEHCLEGKQFEYPIYYDVEDKIMIALSKAELTEVIETWCAAFVSAIAIKQFGKTEATELFPLSANCAGIINRAKKKGIWIENDAYVPSPDDWILYDWSDKGVGDDTTSYDHVGIVKDVSGNKIIVIEGNRNDKCAYREQPLDGLYTRGFVHPKYPETSSSSSGSTNLLSQWRHRMLSPGSTGTETNA